MERQLIQNYLHLLQDELVVALGCTEPIAIAYAAARARELLGVFPQRMVVHCSGNIVKNVMGVSVPSSGGHKGIDTSAILGALGGDASQKLEVLTTITPEYIHELELLLDSDLCTIDLIEDKSNLQIIVEMWHDDDHTLVEILHAHTNIVHEEKNGTVLFSADTQQTVSSINHSDVFTTLSDIYQFALEVPLSDLEPLIEPQIKHNLMISQEGLKGSYGAAVGTTLLKRFGNDVRTRARAWAAAGSDARMSGCSMPVVINSGSGNQGMTVSLPVLAYSEHLSCSKEQLYRALALSNLVAMYQKSHLGKLSAYCGAVSAAAGAGAGIAFLHQSSFQVISDTITNTLANVAGIVCDGAKPSCAAKIASSVDAAIMGFAMAQDGLVFQSGEGLVKDNIDETISSVGRMGREGMRATDTEILNIMLGK